MAVGLAIAILTILDISVPFAAMPIVRLAFFIPIYEAAVVVNDLLTSAVFVVLFYKRGERGLLFLAAG